VTRSRTLIALLAVLASCLSAAATADADPIVAAAGDIACPPGMAATATTCAQQRTSDLIGTVNDVLPLGDNQYDGGSLANYNGAYKPSWGRFDVLAHPVPGNHEYGSAGARGFWDYFGARAGTRGQGWYSYDIGAWHVLAINSECNRLPAGTCAAGGAEETWVRTDLAAHKNPCTLAYWHEPRFSSGITTVVNAAAMAPIWDDLYNANADLVLAAHRHAYERFSPLNTSGSVDTARGVREIVVGTGGRDHAGGTARTAGSQVRNTTAFGVLKVTLHPTAYDWNFVPEPGRSFSDSGSTSCH
jgi:Calcineurin-like phosphoesterase